MRLSRTVLYALQALLHLAQYGDNTPVPCSRVAADGQMPERFLLQVLRILVTHGILASTRGVEGGYRLVRPLEEISLLEVIEAIEGQVTPGSEQWGPGLPSPARNRLAEAVQRATQAAREQLASVTLADLLEAGATKGVQEAPVG